MARWLTHREIHEYLRDTLGVNVTEAAVSAWGKKGYFGPSNGCHPRRYQWMDVKQGAVNIPDRRVRLTPEQVDAIRRSSGIKNAVLARQYGVHESHIYRIRTGQRRTN